jgi:hypothetical protein
VANPSIVQNVNSSTITGTTQCVITLGNTTTGNTVVVLACGYDGATLRTVSTIVISNGSQSLAKQVAQPGSASAYTSSEGWALANITGGTAPTVTITFSGTVTIVNCWAFEVSNMPTSLNLLATSQAGTGSGNYSQGPINNTVGPAIAFFICSTSGSASAASTPWTPTWNPSNTTNSLAAQVLSSTGNVSSSCTNSGGWGGIFFILGGVSGGATPVDATWSANPKSTLTMNDEVLRNSTWSAGPKATLTMTEQILRLASITFSPKTTLTLLAQTIHNSTITFSPHTTLGLRATNSGGPGSIVPAQPWFWRFGR